METLTVNTVKTMLHDKSLATLAKTVFQAMAYESVVRDIVEPKQQEVISFFKFKVAPDNLRLTDKTMIESYNELYLVSDEDMQLYCKEMHEFYIEQGFKVDMNYCPLLMAESLTRDAKRYFVDALSSYTGLTFDRLICSGMSIYKEYVELNLKYFASVVKA